MAAVEVLVTRDQVDTALRDDNNQGALHLAAMHDSSSIVELLLKMGFPSDAQDSEVISTSVCKCTKQHILLVSLVCLGRASILFTMTECFLL